MVLDAIRRTREATFCLLSEQGKATWSPHDHFLAEVLGRVRIAEGCCRLRYPRKLWNGAEVEEGLRDMKKAAYPSV